MNISGECVNCKFYNIDEHTCTNRSGFYYKRHDFHAADASCDMWQACKLYADELRKMDKPKKLTNKDMVPNPWLRWAELKQKDLIHE